MHLHPSPTSPHLNTIPFCVHSLAVPLLPPAQTAVCCAPYSVPLAVLWGQVWQTAQSALAAIPVASQYLHQALDTRSVCIVGDIWWCVGRVVWWCTRRKDVYDGENRVYSEAAGIYLRVCLLHHTLPCKNTTPHTSYPSKEKHKRKNHQPQGVVHQRHKLVPSQHHNCSQCPHRGHAIAGCSICVLCCNRLLYNQVAV